MNYSAGNEIKFLVVSKKFFKFVEMCCFICEGLLTFKAYKRDQFSVACLFHMSMSNHLQKTNNSKHNCTKSVNCTKTNVVTRRTR